MHNITISLQDDMLKASRLYAKQHDISLNALIRMLLAKTVTRPTGTAWAEEFFRLGDRIKANSRGKKWSRDELHDG